MGELCFPRFEPTPAIKKPSAVARPVSHVPSFEQTCCPGVLRLVPADGGSSSPRYGSILSSSFSKLVHTSGRISGLSNRGMQCSTVRTGVTVTCAASRLRLSTYRLITASSSPGSFLWGPLTNYIVFCQGLVLAGIEIASFEAFISHHISAANSSGVGGSERGP